ncbi:MAG: hypothetical protein HY909_26520 [Deltaproteobacteria bacterium]|nr:hypothetical protein [Deltaproteobacteria bacterium]
MARERSTAARLVALAAFCGCGGGDTPDVPLTPVRVAVVTEVPHLRCAMAAEAAVPDGRTAGGVECLPVGAQARAAVDWPEPPATAPFRAPVRYVSPMATAGGDGTTRERAFNSLTAAAASLGDAGGTLVLSRGRLALDQPLELLGPVAVVGAGAGEGSTVALTGAGALRLRGVGAELRDLAVVREGAPPTAGAPSVEVPSGASARLEDVRVEGAGVGLLVSGGSVEAQRVTVARSAGDGVKVTLGGRAVLARLYVHHGAGRGVVSEASVVHLRDSLVYENGDTGVLLQGRAGMGAGAASCGLEGPSGAGALQCLSRVSIVCNTRVGLAVSGITVASPGPEVEGRRLNVSGTRSTGRDGDGVYLGARSVLRLDRDLRDDALRGAGSQVLGNARTGFLASGASRLAVSGARVGYNLGPGMMVQDSATVESLGYSAFLQNRGLSVGVTPTGSVVEIVCNTITETIPARLATALGMLEAADGISVGGSVVAGADGAVAVRQNDVQQNARFGMLFDGRVTVTLQGNRVTQNGFPIGAYNGATISGAGYSPEAQPRAVPPRVTGL